MLMIKNCFAILKCFCFYYDKLFSDEEVVILGGFADGYLTQVQKLNILTGTVYLSSQSWARDNFLR